MMLHHPLLETIEMIVALGLKNIKPFPLNSVHSILFEDIDLDKVAKMKDERLIVLRRLTALLAKLNILICSRLDFRSTGIYDVGNLIRTMIYVKQKSGLTNWENRFRDNRGDKVEEYLKRYSLGF